MQNKEANLRLMRFITELDDGEYEVDTSKGKFKIEKSKFEENRQIYRHILITDEKGNPFSQYYFSHNWGDGGYDHKAEREIDYSNQINLEYGYSVDIAEGAILIYQNEDHNKFYRIREDYISDEYYNKIAWIENDTIFDRLIDINLNNFDRTISINNNQVIIPKSKDIEEELTKYNQEVNKLKQQITNNKYLSTIINEDLCKLKFNFKDVKFSDFKKQEEELLKVYKLYLEAMKIMNYQHDIGIMREIVAGLNPEFHKLFKHSCRSKYDQISPTLDKELLKLKCGVYFIPLTKGLMQIDILPNDYCLKNAVDGNPITEIEKSVLLELIAQVKEIVKKQQEEDQEQEKKFKKEQIKQLTRELKMLENNQ